MPSLPKQLLCHLLLAMAAVYMIWAYKDVAGDVPIVCCSGIYTDEE